MHDKEHQGLQKERIGDDYPWTIARIGDQYWQPIHCITGEKGPKYVVSGQYYQSSIGSVDGKTVSAHIAAERWIASEKKHRAIVDGARKKRELRNRAKREETIESITDGLTEYSFLLPADHDYSSLQSVLVSQFDGYTRQDGIEGAWNDSGHTMYDKLVRFSVAIKTGDYSALRLIVQSARRDEKQDCVYFAKTATDVEWLI